MKNVIEAMEKIGSNASLKEFETIGEMLGSLSIDSRVLKLEKNISRDLICSLEPAEDED